MTLRVNSTSQLGRFSSQPIDGLKKAFYINDLAKQMLWAIENHDAMKALGRNAKEVAEDRFDIENVAKEYEERLLNIHFQLIRKK